MWSLTGSAVLSTRQFAVTGRYMPEYTMFRNILELSSSVNHCCNRPSIHPKCRQGTRSLASPAPSSASEEAGESRLPGDEANIIFLGRSTVDTDCTARA